MVGISKVRNEEAIIADTIEHYLEFCDHLYIVDESSTDNTYTILKNHPRVTATQVPLQPDRRKAEYELRNIAYQQALEVKPDWVVCFDADERIDWDFTGYEAYDAVRMALYDFHITPEDADKNYTEREWVDPHPRYIIMMFKPEKAEGYSKPDQREVHIPKNNVLDAGKVKHYGKAISVEEWEKTCDYYSTWPEPYRSKWTARHGKAIKTDYMSDFGEPLRRYNEL